MTAGVAWSSLQFLHLAEPGAVDVIDLVTLHNIATVDVGQQAGGIDFWKVVAPK